MEEEPEERWRWSREGQARQVWSAAPGRAFCQPGACAPGLLSGFLPEWVSVLFRGSKVRPEWVSTVTPLVTLGFCETSVCSFWLDSALSEARGPSRVRGIQPGMSFPLPSEFLPQQHLADQLEACLCLVLPPLHGDGKGSCMSHAPSREASVLSRRLVEVLPWHLPLLTLLLALSCPLSQPHLPLALLHTVHPSL